MRRSPIRVVRFLPRPELTRFVGGALLAACGALLSGGVLVGCESSAERRTWQASDHIHPPSSEVDPARVPQAPEAQGTPTERAAMALWRTQCASCHGAAGQGGGPGLPPGAQVPNFAQAAFQEARTDEALAEVIVNGRGMMPKFGDKLSEDGVSALVTLIRAMGPRPAGEEPTEGGSVTPGGVAPAGAAAPALPPGHP